MGDGRALRERHMRRALLVVHSRGPPSIDAPSPLCDNTEAYSCFRTLGVPNAATSFGTAPDYWNYLLKGMTFLPKWVLRDRAMMQALARVSEPVVRLVDRLVRLWTGWMRGGGMG